MTNCARLCKGIPSPIHVFSVADFGVPVGAFCREQVSACRSAPWDEYDARRERIEFLRRYARLQQTDVPRFCSYFEGNQPLESLSAQINQLSPLQRAKFENIQPFRRRAFGKLIATRAPSGWQFARALSPPFVQKHGKVQYTNIDYRTLVRTFAEIDNRYITTRLFTQVLQGIAGQVHSYHPRIKKLEMLVHHVSVVTSAERIRGNSPEGIHQDGFDYIVSALVLERQQVAGGESQVFAGDKLTRLCTVTLQPGQGILQPDKQSALWHQVTPVHPLLPARSGIRSSIGLDIALCL